MARTRRKMKNRSRAHIAFVKAERKKRLRAAGGRRTGASRARRRLKRLTKKRGRK